MCQLLLFWEPGLSGLRYQVEEADFSASPARRVSVRAAGCRHLSVRLMRIGLLCQKQRKVTNGTRPDLLPELFLVFLLLTSASVTTPAATTIYTVLGESVLVPFEAISREDTRSGRASST